MKITLDWEEECHKVDCDAVASVLAMYDKERDGVQLEVCLSTDSTYSNAMALIDALEYAKKSIVELIDKDMSAGD